MLTPIPVAIESVRDASLKPAKFVRRCSYDRMDTTNRMLPSNEYRAVYGLHFSEPLGYTALEGASYTSAKV